MTVPRSHGTLVHPEEGVDLRRDTKASEYTDARAHALRERYVELFGGDEIPVPVDRIAEDYLGLTVEASALDGLSGVLYPAERRIGVNAAEPEARRRFTLAHELGHWICQCVGRTPAPLYCRADEVTADPTGKALEREANIFAAELLMPELSVRAAFARADDRNELARAFGVSAPAMHWRLYSFGLLSEGPDKSA